MIDLNARPGREVEARTQPVTVRVLHLDGRRMTTGFLRQIPIVWLEDWPRTRLGWVRDQGRPWLLWRDEGNQPVRSDAARGLDSNRQER